MRCLLRQITAGHHVVEQHLDVHLVVRAVHAAGIVDRVGVHAPALHCKLDASELSEAEIASLADDAASELFAIYSHDVVGPIADFGVRFSPRFHVGADTSVPQEIHGCLEHLRDQLAGRQRLSFDGERGSSLAAERNRLGASRVDASALGQYRTIEVVPTRPWQRKEPLAFQERRLGIRVGIDEYVHVVERAHKPDMPREQHAVAEHVTSHVTDADDGEVGLLRVEAELPEVPLDRFPRPARGDSHPLVVIALRPSRSERVAEPEPVLERDCIGDVGECRGALVGCDHQVGIVAVVAHDRGRRRDQPILEVVRHVEQPADEDPVAGDALFLNRLPAHRAPTWR